MCCERAGGVLFLKDALAAEQRGHIVSLSCYYPVSKTMLPVPLKKVTISETSCVFSFITVGGGGSVLG